MCSTGLVGGGCFLRIQGFFKAGTGSCPAVREVCGAQNPIVPDKNLRVLSTMAATHFALQMPALRNPPTHPPTHTHTHTHRHTNTHTRPQLQPSERRHAGRSPVKTQRWPRIKRMPVPSYGYVYCCDSYCTHDIIAMTMLTIAAVVSLARGRNCLMTV